MITKRQLRRLALRTSRYPSWRPVLHDALLEMYPEEFGRVIEAAEEASRRGASDGYRDTYIIVFRPGAMSARKNKPSWLGLFTTYAVPKYVANGLTSVMRQLQSEHLGDPLVLAYKTDPSVYKLSKRKRL